MYKVIITGSRYWMDAYNVVFSRLKNLPHNSLIIHGGAAGIDSAAHVVAKELGLHTAVFEANWTRGKKAGPERNRLMVDLMNPDLVIAFHEDPGLGKGTKNMVEYAKSKGLTVEIILKK